MQIFGQKVTEPKYFGRKVTHQSKVFGRKNPGQYHLTLSGNSESKREITPNLEKKY